MGLGMHPDMEGTPRARTKSFRPRYTGGWWGGYRLCRRGCWYPQPTELDAGNCLLCGHHKEAMVSYRMLSLDWPLGKSSSPQRPPLGPYLALQC